MTVFPVFGRPVVVGHRGVRRPGVAENTAPAFAAAAAEGADWVELDARRSADGVPVVYHDGCTADGVAVVQRTSRQLAASGIVTLADALAGLPPELGVNVEVKNLPGEPDYDPDDAIAVAVAEVVEHHAANRPVLLSSFNPLTVAALTARLPELPVGLIHYDAISVSDAAGIAVEYGAAALSSRVGAHGLDVEGIAAAHDAGLAVMAWTVNDLDEAHRLTVAGIDAICTDDPGALRRALDATRPG